MSRVFGISFSHITWKLGTVHKCACRPDNASFLPVGSIAALNYGNQLMTMVVGIFAASVSAAYYPYIIEDFHSSAYQDLNRRVQKAFNVIQAIMIPSAIGLIILGFPLAKLLVPAWQFLAKRCTSYRNPYKSLRDWPLCCWFEHALPTALLHHWRHIYPNENS